MKTIRFEVAENTRNKGEKDEYQEYFIKAVEQGTAKRTGEVLEGFSIVDFAEDGRSFSFESHAKYFTDLMNDGLKYRGEFKASEIEGVINKL